MGEMEKGNVEFMGRKWASLQYFPMPDSSPSALSLGSPFPNIAPIPSASISFGWQHPPCPEAESLCRNQQAMSYWLRVLRLQTAVTSAMTVATTMKAHLVQLAFMLLSVGKNPVAKGGNHKGLGSR